MKIGFRIASEAKILAWQKVRKKLHIAVGFYSQKVQYTCHNLKSHEIKVYKH